MRRTLKVLRLLLCGVLGGLALAAAVLPLAIAGGGAAKAGGDTWESLPTALATPPAAQTSYLYANDGRTLITAFYDENRRDVPLDQVAPVLRQAVVAAEDTRFYQHHGVDVRGVARAFVSNSRGGAQQGASTLTMQYVRNVLKNDPGLTPQQHLDALADTPARKVREMRYAQALEQRMSKSEILQRYLNISYFGAGAYGIAAAAETYFGKP